MLAWGNGPAGIQNRGQAKESLEQMAVRPDNNELLLGTLSRYIIMSSVEIGLINIPKISKWQLKPFLLPITKHSLTYWDLKNKVDISETLRTVLW